MPFIFLMNNKLVDAILREVIDLYTREIGPPAKRPSSFWNFIYFKQPFETKD